MEKEFVEIVEVRTERHRLLTSIELNLEGLGNAASKFNFDLASYIFDPNIDRLKKIFLLAESYDSIFKKYNIYNLFKNEISNNDVINKFISNVKEYSEKLHEYASDPESKYFDRSSFWLSLINNFEFSLTYTLKKYNSVEDLNYRNLVMFSVKSADNVKYDDIDDEDELDEFMDNEMFDEYDDDLNEDENSSDNKFDKALNLNIQNFSYLDEIYRYPIHEDMLVHIKNKLVSTYDTEEICKLLIYIDFYKVDFKYQELINDINDIMDTKLMHLRKINPNYRDSLKFWKENTDFMAPNQPTVYTDEEEFITYLIDKLVKLKNISIFNDIKKIFKGYDLNDKVSSMYAVKELADLLSTYKLKDELKCLNNIVNDNNVVYFTNDLYAYFDTVVKDVTYEKLFGKHFADDLNDKERGND